MNTNIFIPQTIKVGFQNRSDTYNGKLAYVIYYDAKNKLRKEKSWSSWRDHKIDPQDFKNEPISGFVLNKKVGGTRYEWNPRQTYTRVFDPRGFEFEVTIPNLLYILENTNSIKGKGLEGDFVYGWDGTEILLIPVEAPEYKQLAAYSTLLANPESIKGKDLILGATYRTSGNEEAVYLGRFDHYADNYYQPGKPTGKKYFFKCGGRYLTPKSLGKVIVQLISADPVSNYAELMEELECSNIYSPIDRRLDKYVVLTQDEIIAANRYYHEVFIDYESGKLAVYLKKDEDTIVHKDDYRSYPSRLSYTADPSVLFVRKIKEEQRAQRLSLLQLHEKYHFSKLVKHLANGKPYER